jgi:hypothetical protein
MRTHHPRFEERKEVRRTEHASSIVTGNRLYALAPGSVRLLTLQHLDRRTAGFRQIMHLVSGIETDLGGDLTHVAHQLVVRAAVMVAMCEHLEAQWVNGDKINIEEYLSIANGARRFLQTIGTKRIPKELGDLEQHLEDLAGKSPVKYQQWAERNRETVDAIVEESE